jgi:predicted DsbA family dithiol-disulfide isomerase
VSDKPNEPAPLRIDIVSDVVCPWCIVGFKQLEGAMTRLGDGLALELRWHPFELNPQMPPEGQDLLEHVAEKYGSTQEESLATRAQLTALGQELGFAFCYSDEMRMVNSFRAHQLLHWAGVLGKQHALKLALFEAYFSRQERIDDPAVLAAIAARSGLDPQEAAAVLEDGRYGEAVRESQAFWQQQGIQGVPAMIFQERYLVSGAQGVENYARILQQLTDDKAA